MTSNLPVDTNATQMHDAGCGKENITRIPKITHQLSKYPMSQDGDRCFKGHGKQRHQNIGTSQTHLFPRRQADVSF